MKVFRTAALLWIAATVLAVPAASGRSILIQSCKLPSGVTVLHNGPCSEVESQAPAAPAQGSLTAAAGMQSIPGGPAIPGGPGIKRDAFLMLLKGTVNAECENPKSVFACMVKSPDICRKTLPQATDHCEKTMKTQLPAEIRSREEGRQWGMQLGQCVANHYIVLAGTNNLDGSKCAHLIK